MKTLLRLVLVCLMVVVAAPAFSGDAVQMWRCEMDDDATEDHIRAMAAKWLESAKKVPGGEEFEFYVLFPIAVNGTGEIDLMLVVVAPSFQDWGKFWDSFAGSEAAALDAQHQASIVCPDSVVWESFKIE